MSHLNKYISESVKMRDDIIERINVNSMIITCYVVQAIGIFGAVTGGIIAVCTGQLLAVVLVIVCLMILTIGFLFQRPNIVRQHQMRKISQSISGLYKEIQSFSKTNGASVLSIGRAEFVTVRFSRKPPSMWLIEGYQPRLLNESKPSFSAYLKLDQLLEADGSKELMEYSEELCDFLVELTVALRAQAALQQRFDGFLISTMEAELEALLEGERGDSV